MSARPIYEVIQGQKLIAASRALSVREAAQLMMREKVGALLIIESGRLLGIFTERDALARVLAAGRDPDSATLGEVMTPDPVTLPADRPLNHALHLMYEGGFRHMPVTKEGRAIGVVSARDALGCEMSEFEDELTERDELAEQIR